MADPHSGRITCSCDQDAVECDHYGVSWIPEDKVILKIVIF